MNRKLAVAVVVLILLLIGGVLVILRLVNNPPSVIEDLILTSRITLEDFHFQIAYPEGWVYEAQPGSLILAPDGESLVLESDGKSDTLPAQATITLNALPLESLNFDQHATLDQASATFTASNDLRVADSFDLSVMGRRARTLVASGPGGRSGFATFWLQEGFLMLFTLNLPDEQSGASFAYTWGQMLGAVQPISGLALGEPVEVPQTAFQLAYPLDWQVVSAEAPYRVGDESAGLSLSVFDVPLEDLANSGNVGLPALTQSVSQTLGLVQIAAQEEYLIGGNAALTITGPTDEAVWLRVLFVPIGEEVAFVMAAAPDREAMNAFQPTWNAVIDSVVLIGSES